MNAEVLGRFAANARLSPDERADVDCVARLYILAHIAGAADDEPAHALVGSDYRATRLRMRAPTLEAYRARAIDAPTFLEYVERAHREAPSEERAPGFLAFEHAMFARPRGEERYRYVTRPGKWRECAAYLMLGMRAAPGFGDMARTLGLEPHALAACAVPDGYAREAAALLASMALPREEAERVWIQAPPQEESAPKERVPEAPKARQEPVVLVLAADEQAPATLAPLRGEMSAFRARALLGVNFDLGRLAKQMVLSAAGIERAPGALLGDYQSEQLPALTEDERATALRALEALQFGAASRAQLQESASARALAHACGQRAWETRQLVRALVDPRAHLNPQQYERFVAVPQDSALAGAIAAALACE